MGFGGLLSLPTGESASVTFNALEPYANVSIVVAQDLTGALEVFDDPTVEPQGDDSITWTFSVVLGDVFESGNAVVTFEGSAPGGAFSASCEVTLR